MTTRRKLAIATWAAPREGNIYGKISLDATEVLRYLAHVRELTGEKVTLTHFVGRAVAEALSKAPSLNGYLRLGRYIPHETVDVAYLVALEEGADLAKAKVCRANEKSTSAIAAELRERAQRLRDRKDDDFEKSKGMLKALPTWLIRPLVWLTGWLTGSLGIGAKPLGLEAFPFGSCIITSVGMFGLDEGYAPPTPFARVPVYVLIGALRDQPVAVDGQVVVRPIVTLTATIDHRFMDGHQGGVLASVIRSSFADPWSLEGVERPAEPAAAS